MASHGLVMHLKLFCSIEERRSPDPWLGLCDWWNETSPVGCPRHASTWNQFPSQDKTFFHIPYVHVSKLCSDRLLWPALQVQLMFCHTFLQYRTTFCLRHLGIMTVWMPDWKWHKKTNLCADLDLLRLISITRPSASEQLGEVFFSFF